MFEAGLPDESFHDAEILTAFLDRQGPTLELVVEVYPATERAARYRLRFTGITSLEMTDLNEQNVLFDLRVELALDGSSEVTLLPTYGLSGALSCRQVAFERV